ncbi:uncharacterized protein LACBIDRAFT_306406 [Laccaria bicolor S238N-H82]|uniref:Predicted protein n=1 Tax=Laccaria bicolor (strain S238N-H82 / ATCC MYA-4686) TaxID=486041 RepID=B0DMU5_LACBS|nr:uncharacterized protein LACBIDRAFT_306406 [Laccaria bicolor S238N-H82]EDR04031.1 predicted protein [Laccaria bicolor S238N-H82]|eukprot:XP_001885286.1 predicted protein [Laccaria bicolor S238N-H82]
MNIRNLRSLADATPYDPQPKVDLPQAHPMRFAMFVSDAYRFTFGGVAKMIGHIHENREIG